MLLVRILLSTLHSLNLWTGLPSSVIAWGQGGLSLGELIRPKCITILYCKFTLLIDIFHFKVLFLCCFGLFYTVYNFQVPKQQNQNSAGEKWTSSCLIRSTPNSMKFDVDHYFEDSLEETKDGPEGTHQGSRRVPGAPLGRARHPPVCLVAPLGAPFGLYYPLG